MAKKVYSNTRSVHAPAYDAFDITPDDNAELVTKPRGLYVGVQGDLAVVMIEGGEVIFKQAAKGIHPLRVKKVLSTGTTATDILGLI